MDGVRFRQPGALGVAAFVGLIGAVPLASQHWYFAPVLLLPLGLLAWVVRSGTDADGHGLRVRAVLGQRRIPWSAVAELGPDHRGGAQALLTDGRAVRLPAVRADALPRLVAASGEQLTGGARTAGHPSGH